jgi:hypothetical protein
MEVHARRLKGGGIFTKMEFVRYYVEYLYEFGYNGTLIVFSSIG